MGVHIKLIGRPEIRDVSGELRRIRGTKPWALLARILLTERPLSRRRLANELFSEAEDPLGSLRWCLAELRRAVGSAEAFSGDPVAANLPDGTVTDVSEVGVATFQGFEELGGLLEGIDPRSGPEFESWLLVERERTAALIDAQLREAVLRALSLGENDRAADLGQVAVSRQPYDEGTHILFVKALVAAGMGEAAERHVAATEERFSAELGTAPTSALRNATRPAVADPAPGVSARAVASALLDAGLAALDAGAVDAGMECLRRAVAEAERSRDRRLRSMALLELGTALVHSVRGYDDEGAVLLRQAAELGKETSDAAVAARALRELGYTDALVGRRPTAIAYLQEAAQLANGDGELLAGVHAVMGFNLAEWGRYEAGLHNYELSIELARSSCTPRREAWSMGLGARAQLMRGDVDRAEAWLKGCLEVVADEQWVAFRPWPLALLGELRLDRGEDPSTVRGELEETFALSCQLGDPCWEGTAARAIALSHAASGDLEPALTWITQALQRCRRVTDAYAGMEASILATDAELSLRAADPVRAEAAARALLTLAARTHQDGFVRDALNLLAIR